MASVLDDRSADGERSGRPRTSHRRRAPRRVRGLRRSAVTAAVAGLAVTTPLILHGHPENQVVLGPGGSAPVVPAPAATTAGDGAPAPSADPASVAGGRDGDPVSRDATRSATPALPSRTLTQSSQSPQSSPSTPAATGTKVIQASPDRAAAYEAQVVALTNQQRLAYGCPALRDDPRLRAAAMGHSVDMQTRDYFAHDTPDGVTPWTRIGAQGYTDPSAENIAKGQQTPQAVVDAWMNSPGHRANILSCSSKAIGVGVQFGPSGPWWTQDFGYS